MMQAATETLRKKHALFVPIPDSHGSGGGFCLPETSLALQNDLRSWKDLPFLVFLHQTVQLIAYHILRNGGDWSTCTATTPATSNINYSVFYQVLCTAVCCCAISSRMSSVLFIVYDFTVSSFFRLALRSVGYVLSSLFGSY